MSIKVFWWMLLIAQLLLYVGRTPLGNQPFYEVVGIGSFAIAWGSVTCLIYGYKCKRGNKKFNKILALILFSFVIVLVMLFYHYFSLGGYFLAFWVLLASMFTFIFTLLLSIKTLIFVRDGK